MILEHVLKRITDYQNLKIYGKSVITPYYINNFESNLKTLLRGAGVAEGKIVEIITLYKEQAIPYGWYRGKGTPEELESAAVKVAERADLELDNSTALAAAEFMKLFGLGVDCSGFVFNVLSYAFEKEGLLETFLSQLAWEDPEKRGAHRAGVFVFGSNKLSTVKPPEIRPLDMLILKVEGDYKHMALVYKDSGKLKTAESTINSVPTGIHISEISFENGLPIFTGNLAMGRSFNHHIDRGLIEIRRLNIPQIENELF
jgi:hypothetical protein